MFENFGLGMLVLGIERWRTNLGEFGAGRVGRHAFEGAEDLGCADCVFLGL